MLHQIINSYRLLIKDETSEIANYMEQTRGTDLSTVLRNAIQLNRNTLSKQSFKKILGLVTHIRVIL